MNDLIKAIEGIKIYYDYFHMSFNLEKYSSESKTKIDEIYSYCIDKKSNNFFNGMKANFVQLFTSKIQTIANQLHGFGSTLLDSLDVNKNKNGEFNLERDKKYNTLVNSFNNLKFNIKILDQFKSFEQNIVLIGANGSGKTTLTNIFKQFMGNNSIMIAAQRLMNINRLSVIRNPVDIDSSLTKYWRKDNTYKTESSYNDIIHDYKTVFEKIISLEIASNRIDKEQNIKLFNDETHIKPPTITQLDTLLEIWNDLIPHVTLSCPDGMNLRVSDKSGNTYDSIGLSDGEKVIIYLISHVLLAPKNGFIIVDEPELYLHKSIVKRLWDTLEKQRKDCIFIYLTHDLDFASSRTNTTKSWIKSYVPPHDWIIQNIPETEIPEQLIMQLVGTRKMILFCEGTKDSKSKKYDYLVYSKLFKSFEVIPVGSCKNVINYTKAYNSIISINCNAYGIIDRDCRSQTEIDSLKEKNIFAIEVAEIENLFLDKDIIENAIAWYDCTSVKLDDIIEAVFNYFNNRIEQQASQHVSSRINYIFNESHMKKGYTKDDIISNYTKFQDSIDIEQWYSDFNSELTQICTDKDYIKLIKKCNDKGLISLISKQLNMGDYIDRLIARMKKDNCIQKILYRYMPAELVEIEEE